MNFMAKQGVFLVVFSVVMLLLLAFAVSAANPTIFSGNVRDRGEYGASNGENFSVTYFKSENKIVLSFPNEALSIEEGDCSIGNALEGCFTGSSFVGYNYSLTDVEVYDYSITVKLLTADIRISKVIEKNPIEIGEETTVFVNITNSGVMSSEVFFTEIIPSELKVIELPNQDCELTKINTLTTSNEMVPNEKWNCNYKVKSSTPGTYSLNSKASFDIIERTTTNSFAQLVVDDLAFDANISYEKPLLGREFSIILTLSSTKDLESLTTVTFISDSIAKVGKVKSVNELYEDDPAKKYKHNDGTDVLYGDKLPSFAKDSPIEINISSEAVGAGQFFIAVTANWTLNESKQSKIISFPIEIELAKPTFRINGYDTVTGEATIDVVNPSHVKFSDVSVTSFNFRDGGTKSVGDINVIGHKTFNAVLGGITNTSFATVSYTTPFGQKIDSTVLFGINISKYAAEPFTVDDIQEQAENFEPEPEGSVELPVEAEPKQLEVVKEPKENSGFGDLKIPFIMVGIIIGIIVVFLFFKGRDNDNEEFESESEIISS
jgi:hypothetical protein